MRKGNVYRCWDWSVSRHKTIEFQLSRWEHWSWFSFILEWTRKQDHAGFRLEAEVLGYSIILLLYDNRHWDHDAGTWSRLP